MNLDPTTFGKSPAAMYLARTLNQLNSKIIAGNIGRVITHMNKTTLNIIRAYESGVLTPSAAATCLRLLRKEVSESQGSFNFVDSLELQRLAWKLARNVQIALIKRGLNVCSLSRKAERVMETKHRHVKLVVKQERQYSDVTQYNFVDSTTGKLHEAGVVYTPKENGNIPVINTNVFYLEDIEDKNDMLMEKSQRRIARRGLKFEN